MLEMILSVDARGGLAKNGKIPWRFSKDMSWFRDKTASKLLVGGPKTWAEIGKPLVDRKRLGACLSRYLHHVPFDRLGWFQTAGSVVAAAETSDVMIIGGPALYDLFAMSCSRMYLTEIDHDFQCDAFATFSMDSWHEVYSKETWDSSKKGHTCNIRFSIWER